METVSDPYLRHLFDGHAIFNVYSKEAMNLSVGAPGPDLLQHCVEMIRRSTNHRLNEEQKEEKFYLFQYGTVAGLWECREELSKFLSRRYGDPVNRENLILSCGATHGLQLLLNTIVSPNGIIFVEEATYMIALDVFRQYSLMKIVTVPMKNDVVDLDALEKIVKENRNNGDWFFNQQKIFWAMFYTIPTFHNPTGMTLPPESCKRLVEIARNNSILVACDDVYNLLHYGEGFPPHRLFYYDDPSDSNYKGGNVVSNCSFSKILSPAIRLGWIESRPRIKNIMTTSGILRSGGAVNHYVSGVIASLLHLNIEDEFIDHLTNTYKERVNVLCDTFDHYLPRCCSYRRPEGGYFAWIRLPIGINATDFIKFCQAEHKVSAIPGSEFSLTGKCENFLRVSIGFHEKETLSKALKTLCTALLEYIRKSGECNKNCNFNETLKI